MNNTEAVIIHSRDGHLWNIEEKILEIINKIVKSNDRIIINFNSEGPCLTSCNFYEILDNISRIFNLDKKRFIIYTSNVEEFHNEYQINITNNVWVLASKQNSKHVAIKNQDLFTVGCFVGKLNWARLSLLAWLDFNYKEKSKITCHYDQSINTHRASLQLNHNMLNAPSEITQVIDFLKTCPRLLSEHDSLLIAYNNLKTLSFNEITECCYGHHDNFVDVYSSIFLELVCETYFSGRTFFPTEKTFRPILQMTPFVIFGPIGFLGNLRRCGFKTFNDFWDESYDNLQDYDRILKIRSILAEIFTYDKKMLAEMYNKMLPILEYNRNRLLELHPTDLLFDVQKS